MQITKQADYALRAMMYLAKTEDTQRSSTSQIAREQDIPSSSPVKADQKKRSSTSQIAREQHIPSSFLAKIISQLSIAGLVSTSRGAHGGVSLARKPEDISVLEVVEAIDGPIVINDCTISLSACPFGDDCALQPIWCEVQSHLVEKLRSTTFATILQPSTKG